jgi:PAS domain S-box-containing protein
MDQPSILLVEDQKAIAWEIEKKLRALNYRVVAVATSSEEALERAAELRPDLVLMELKVQGHLSGAEAAKKILDYLDIPVVYLIAYAGDRTLRHSAELPHGYVVDPMNHRELMTTIETIRYKHSMQQQLRESEARYKAISELSSDYAYAVDVQPDGRLRWAWVTEAFTRITGYTLAELNRAGGIQALVHAEDRAPVLARTRRLLAGHAETHEFRITTKAGEVRWLRDSARAERERTFDLVNGPGAGRVVRIYGAAQDITQRKRAEDALAASYRREQQRRQLSDTLREVGRIVSSTLEQRKVIDLILTQLDHVVPYDLASVTLLADRTLTRVALRDKASAASPSPDAPPTPAYAIDADKYTLNAEALQRKRPLLLPDVTQSPDWQPSAATQGVRSFINAPLLVQGRPIGLLGLGRREGHPYTEEDVETVFAFATQVAIALANARLVEQTQRALRETEGLFEAAQDILGATEREAIGRATLRHARRLIQADALALYLVDPAQRAIVQQVRHPPRPPDAPPATYDAVLAGLGGAALRTGRPARSPQGDAIAVPLLSQPAGDAPAVIGVITATVARQFTQHAIDLLGSLATQAATAIEKVQLFEAAQAAQAAAEKASQAKSEFLSNMSHELRTPLNGILGYAQILKRERELKPDQRTGLTIIEQSGNHLLDLINDILDLSKIEAHKMELCPTEFNLADFLEGVAGMMRIQAEAKDIACAYTVTGDLPRRIRADAKRLRQVLVNLLGNAVKFTQRGSVELHVKRVDAESDPVTLRFEVKDTGEGIPASQIERIFLPFEQAGDRRRRAEGTGLGLAISQRFVQAMGSELHVTSTVGEGSTFWFDVALPADPDPQAAPTPARRREVVRYQGRPYRVLVVDDKAYNRSVLANLLQPVGFEVTEAENGQAALHEAEAHPPDLIFMDLVMPVMTGIEATQALRAHPTLADVPIVAVTASVLDFDQDHSHVMGCDGFLAKPVKAHELFDVLEELLELTWVYEEVEADDEELPPVFPASDEVQHLRDLAILGDIGAIRERARHIERQDAKYRPFARKLLDFAEAFDDEGLLTFIEQPQGGGEG